MTKDKGLPLTSNHWGTYIEKVKDGKNQELLGWEHDKDPSPIAQGIQDLHNDICFFMIVILVFV